MCSVFSGIPSIRRVFLAAQSHPFSFILFGIANKGTTVEG
jgi:hypothetical protein